MMSEPHAVHPAFLKEGECDGICGDTMAGW